MDNFNCLNKIGSVLYRQTLKRIKFYTCYRKKDTKLSMINEYLL